MKALCQETEARQQQMADQYLVKIRNGARVHLGPTAAHEFSRYIPDVVDTLSTELFVSRERNEVDAELSITEALIDLLYCVEQRRRKVRSECRYAILKALVQENVQGAQPTWHPTSGAFLLDAFPRFSNKCETWARRVGRTLQLILEAPGAQEPTSKDRPRDNSVARLSASLGEFGFATVWFYFADRQVEYDSKVQIWELVQKSARTEKLREFAAEYLTLVKTEHRLNWRGDDLARD